MPKIRSYMFMKNWKKSALITSILLLILSFSCIFLTSCGQNASEDSAFLQQTSSVVTETQKLLKQASAMADAMAAEAYRLVPGEDTSDFVSLCRANNESIDQIIVAVRKQMQELERLDSPVTADGQAINAAQQSYYTNILPVLEEMQKTFSFYITQYEEGQVLLTAMSSPSDDYRQYLSDIYQTAFQVKDSYLSLDTPSYLSDLWPLYCSSLDILTQYLESEFSGASGDVLRYYSASQIISRMGIVSASYEETIYGLMAQGFVHDADTLENTLSVLGDEVITACNNGALAEDSTQDNRPVTFFHYTLSDEIYPNLYPAANSVANVLLYTDKDFSSVTITTEIPGFTQACEQQITISPEMTYLMIKPPVLSDMPDLSSARDTQLIFTIKDSYTGEILAQESKPLKLYSIYDYKSYSDEFGIIQNDNILAWMTPESNGVLTVRRNAIAWLEDTFGSDYAMLPGYQPAYGFGQGKEANITYYQVAAIQSAISAMGVRYNMGPYSLNATQRVLMPDAVLSSKSGICIETAVLMASVLQSANMHAMIVFTPGHAQVAVETWKNSGQYFLIETTCLPFDAATDNTGNLIIQLSQEDWSNYLSQEAQQAQDSGGMVYIVDCDLARTLNIKGLAY